MSGPLLIATAAPPESVAGCGETHPRVDYIELQRRTGVDVLDYGGYPRGAAGALLHRFESAVHCDPYLAVQALMRAHRYQRVLCLSERVGLPLAVLRRVGVLRVPVTMLFMAWSWRQEALITRLQLLAHLERIGVNSTAMRDQLLSLGAPPERVQLLRWAIDHQFFTPRSDHDGGGTLISLGEPRHRDYAALFRAVDGLPLTAQVRMSGYPPRRAVGGPALPAPPANVQLLPPLSSTELRALYAQARMVVLPVLDTIYPAGLTALLEAMSMARPVIVTRSRGLSDYVIEGETALLVEAGDVAALRDAIRRLDGDRALARRLGDAARARVEAELNQVRYVAQLATLLGVDSGAGVEVAA